MTYNPGVPFEFLPVEHRKAFRHNEVSSEIIVILTKSLQLKGMAMEVQVGGIPSSIVDSTLDFDVMYHG